MWFTTGLLAPEDVASCTAQGAVGVICGRLINQQGLGLNREIEDRMIGVTLEQMRSKDMGLLVGSVPNRARPMVAAIHGGYATHIATCSNTARDMLDI